MDVLVEEFEGSLCVAALEQGRLEGFEVDPATEEVRWGSIYYGKIKSFDSAIDAAYIDLDGENTGLLYNKDVRLIGPKGQIIKGGAEAITKTFKAGDMVTVQAKTAYLPRDDDLYTRMERKIPQLSMDITLPGRYLIYCPFLEKNRLSSRIREKSLRKQMQKMVDAMKDGDPGIIVRAAAANTQTDILSRERKILTEAWSQMSAHFTGESAQLIMLGPDAIQRTLSDQATMQIDTIEVVTMDHYKTVEEWCSVFAPDLVTKIDPVELENAAQDFALFDFHDMTGQLEELFNTYLLLPGGGNLIIQNTAALTAIDVNRGGDRHSNQTINLEAIREAMRQLRLRNIGGTILIDILKLRNAKEEKQLLSALDEIIQNDPCTVQIHGLTKLGLLEISRARRTPELSQRFDKGVF